MHLGWSARLGYAASGKGFTHDSDIRATVTMFLKKHSEFCLPEAKPALYIRPRCHTEGHCGRNLGSDPCWSREDGYINWACTGLGEFSSFPSSSFPKDLGTITVYYQMNKVSKNTIFQAGIALPPCDNG